MPALVRVAQGGRITFPNGAGDLNQHIVVCVLGGRRLIRDFAFLRYFRLLSWRLEKTDVLGLFALRCGRFLYQLTLSWPIDHCTLLSKNNLTIYKKS